MNSEQKKQKLPRSKNLGRTRCLLTKGIHTREWIPPSPFYMCVMRLNHIHPITLLLPCTSLIPINFPSYVPFNFYPFVDFFSQIGLLGHLRFLLMHRNDLGKVAGSLLVQMGRRRGRQNQ